MRIQAYTAAMPRHLLQPDALDLLAKRFRILGEPFRLRLLEALQHDELSVGELVAVLEASQPNVSRHLQLLADAGFIQRRRSGTSILYAIAEPAVFKLCALALRSATRHTRTTWKELDAAPRAVRSKKK